MNKEDYVKEYFDGNYGDGKADEEIGIVGKFLAENVGSKVLDCGCGPVPQIWAICMPKATEIHAIDLPKESIEFVKNELKHKDRYAENFKDYQKIAEKVAGKLPSDYILKQIEKIKSVQQGDMSVKIPFKYNSFDVVASIFSLGCLNNEMELSSAINEILRVLKNKGKFLHINTNGRNSNNILPEYTWRGLSQSSEIIIPHLEKAGFSDISIKKFKLKENKSMYNYNEIHLISAIKK